MFEFFKKINFTTKKYILNIFTFLLILFTYFTIYFLFIKDDFITFKNTLGQIKIQEDILKIQNDNLNNYQSNLEKFQTLKNKNISLNEKIVNNKTASNYIVALTTMAEDSEIVEIKFEMGLEESIKLEGLKEKPLIYPVKISCIGYFSDTLNFISDIIKLNNFYKITNIYIDENAPVNEGYVQIEVSVDIYGIDTIYND